MRLTKTPKRASDKIQIDILGPLPIPNMTAQTIACTFAKHFITQHGCPLVLQTDQGKNFMAEIMKNIQNTTNAIHCIQQDIALTSWFTGIQLEYHQSLP